jgi:virulence-associated protein VagC
MAKAAPERHVKSFRHGRNRAVRIAREFDRRRAARVSLSERFVGAAGL